MRAESTLNKYYAILNHSMSTGLVLFLEEDHYVAEDFLYLLAMMQQRTKDLCPQCNVLSLGTYLKTFNYYTYHSKVSGGAGCSSAHKC